ncbi:tyrosine-type recombinase/integrase [Limnoglobus roseus]|nr:tyrosine-type recombinase/integrase [Limnoglobus roseus]
MYKPTFTKKLPPNAEVVTRDGKPHVKMRDGGRTVYYPLTECGTKFLKELDTWYAKVKQPNGKRKPVPLSPNKQAAEMMLGQILRDIEMRKAGAVDPHRDHGRTPLADHLAAWGLRLTDDGATPKHVAQTTDRAAKVFTACRFVFPTDIDPEPVQRYLAGRRRERGRDLPAGQSWFKPKELAAALGIKPTALAPTILRHGLAAEGAGKSRRYPRATAEALLAVRNKGASVRTVNTYVASLKAFGNYMVSAKRMAANPFDVLTIGNVELDPRHHRRALSPAELARLVAAAETSTQTVRGLIGPHRATLYIFAASTGFRVSELAILSPMMFRLDATPPTVTPPARGAKNRKLIHQPLPLDVAGRMRGVIAGKGSRQAIWPGDWSNDAAEMLRVDLATAGIPYAVDSPNGPLFADFHAIRHTFIRRLDEAGATLKEAMQLARHSDPKLTMAVYGRASLEELGSVANRLAPIPHVPPHVPTGAETCGRVTTHEETCPPGTGEQGIGRKAGKQGDEGQCGDMRADDECTPGEARTHNLPLRRRQNAGSASCFSATAYGLCRRESPFAHIAGIGLVLLVDTWFR